MNAPARKLQTPLRIALASLVLVALCQPLGLSADKPATGDKAPASDKAPAEPVWYWVKAIDIPTNNPIQKIEWDRTGPPDLMIVVERNGVKVGETEVKEDCWKCVFEKKYQNVFGFRQDPAETYTITILDHDWPDPNDSMLQIVVKGDAFDKDEVVVLEKADTFALKESLVTVTLVKITKEEKAKLQKAAGK